MKKIGLLTFSSVLLLTALSLCVVGLLELQMAYASPYTSINVATAYDMITGGSYPDLVVLDVRTQSEYNGGHIYGAVWIPVTELEARIGELAGHENDEIIVYCGSGVRSVTASGILDSHSFTKVYNMLGGISAWKSAGYPVWIATVHNLNTTFNYDTIQAAIDTPQTLDEHTILVDAGTYYEHVAVNKSISIIGENRSTTIIDGNWTVGNGINVTANNVTISGFTIRNNWEGIYVDGASDNLIKENLVTNSNHSILLEGSSNNTIVENTIVDNQYGIDIHSYSVDNVVYHNNFINNTNQASLESSTSSAEWDNGYEGNYWSDYNGTDVNGDGIGDTETPHLEVDYYPLIYPYGSIRNLDTNLTYLTIQSAINASETLVGHTIFVSSGTYYENVTINKNNLTLVGENRDSTIIDGSKNGYVVYVTANNVDIMGFTIRNSSNTSWHSGVYLNEVSGCSLLNNAFLNNSVGVYVFGSATNIIEDNIVCLNTVRGIYLNSSTGNTIIENDVNSNGNQGIFLESSNNNVVSQNNVSYNGQDGIYLNRSSTGNLVQSNFGIGNLDNGIYVNGANNNTIVGNEVCNSSSGIQVHSADDNFLAHNRLYFNEKGVLINTRSNNTLLVNNTISNNDEGIYLDWFSNYTNLIDNTISSNFYGVYLSNYSSYNTVYHNNFINNTQQVYLYNSYDNTWDNGKEEGNYWSDYNGTDTNGDGIGDTYLPWQGVDYYPLMSPYIPADANHDGYVNVWDLGLLSDAWLTESGEPNYNPHVDFNMDDTINIWDLGTLSDYWLTEV